MIERRWLEDHWTGGLRFGKDRLDPATFDSRYAEPMRANDDAFVRIDYKNKTFGAGLRLQALELGVQVGYSNTTYHVWESVPGCSAQRFVYGENKSPTQAPTVFAACR